MAGRIITVYEEEEATRECQSGPSRGQPYKPRSIDLYHLRSEEPRKLVNRGHGESHNLHDLVWLDQREGVCLQLAGWEAESDLSVE